MTIGVGTQRVTIHTEAFGERGRERGRGTKRQRMEIFGNECPYLEVEEGKKKENKKDERNGQRNWEKIK